MVDIGTFCRIALSFTETSEAPHFETRSFKAGKKIFATLNAPGNRATVKLSAIDQDVFSAFDKMAVYPVPNKWGKQGWTHIDLLTVREELLTDMLKTAYRGVAPKKSAALVSFDEH